jgi:hypothetical protein
LFGDESFSGKRLERENFGGKTMNALARERVKKNEKSTILQRIAEQDQNRRQRLH